MSVARAGHRCARGAAAVSQPAVHQPTVNGDRWEPVKFEACPVGRRIIDVNHHRSLVRWRCDKCRTDHTLRVGAPS